MPVNEYGQMIGESMEGYTPGELPSIDFLEGRYARIEALSVEKHTEDLLAVYGPDTPREMWTYLFQEPVADMEELVMALIRLGDVDLPLSGTGGRQRGTGYSFKSDVGS